MAYSRAIVKRAEARLQNEREQNERFSRAAAIAPRGSSEIEVHLSSTCSGRVRAELISAIPRCTL